MSGIFISYRRADEPGYAGRIADGLRAALGEGVFMDVESLEPGVDFVERIEEAVGSVDVLIAVIGRQWASRDESGRSRLDDPNDFVRLEIASALRRGIRVVPVLVRGAEMPREGELPEDLRALARRHALQLTDSEWRAGMERLVAAVGKTAQQQPEAGAALERTADAAPAAAERETDAAGDWEEALVEVPAAAGEVTAVLHDYEAYPSWLTTLKEVRVSRGPKRGDRAGSETEMQIRSSWTEESLFGNGTVVLRSVPGGVEYRMTAKDRSKVEGQFIVEPHGGTTLVRHRARVRSLGLLSPLSLTNATKKHVRAAFRSGLEADLKRLADVFRSRR